MDEKNILLGYLVWSWKEEFPIKQLQEYIREGKVKDIYEIDDGSDTYVLILTSKRVSKRQAYNIYNQDMRDRYGDGWTNIRPS